MVERAKVCLSRIWLFVLGGVQELAATKHRLATYILLKRR